MGAKCCCCVEAVPEQRTQYSVLGDPKAKDGNSTYVDRGLSLTALMSIKNRYMKLIEIFKPERLNEELRKFINSELYNGDKEIDNCGTVNVYISCSPYQDVCSLIDCIVDWQADYEAKEGKKHMKFYYYVERLCCGGFVDITDMTAVLQKARMLVLILPDWSNFRPLREASCLLEIALATQMDGTSLNVTFPHEKQIEFENAHSSYGSYIDTMNRIKTITNFQKAVSYLSQYERQQYETYLIDNSKINMQVCKGMRSWLIESIKDFAKKTLESPIAIEEAEKARKAYSVLHTAGRCLRDNGELEKSVKFLTKAVEQSDDKKWSNILRLDLSISMVKNRQYNDAKKILDDILLSPEAISEDRRNQAELMTVQCLVAEGDITAARNMLSGRRDIFGYSVIAHLADLDSREGKYIKAGNKFREVRKSDDTQNPNDANVFYENALVDLLYAEHLVRMVSDRSLTIEDHESGVMEAKKYLSVLSSMVMNFGYAWGERHPDSRRASDILLELRLQVNPKHLHQKYLHKYIGMARTWSEIPARGENSLVILHWNILADALAFADLAKDGFACGNNVLSWKNSRRDKIITEILRWKPDVFGLVELDHYDDLRSVFGRLGYDSVWLKKNRDFYKDGGAIFWDRARFVKVDELLAPLKKNKKKADQVLVSVRLETKTGVKKSFAIGCVHLKSTKKASGEEARLDQAKQVVSHYEEKYKDIPRILLADLNGESSENVTRDYEPKAYPFILDSGFRSVYKSVLGVEPDFTSWKFRAKEEFRYTIDFIFHTKDITAKSVLLMPSSDQFDRKLLLPSITMPSDHLPLVTELEMP